MNSAQIVNNKYCTQVAQKLGQILRRQIVAKGRNKKYQQNNSLQLVQIQAQPAPIAKFPPYLNCNYNFLCITPQEELKKLINECGGQLKPQNYYSHNQPNVIQIFNPLSSRANKDSTSLFCNTTQNRLLYPYIYYLVRCIRIAINVRFFFMIILVSNLCYFRLQIQAQFLPIIDIILVQTCKMIDFGKLYCKVHPYELITNFCKKQNCIIGLCATCVCNHTQQHIEQGTTPDYQNIRSTFSEMHKNVRQCIQQFQSDKIRINLLRSNIERKKTVIRDTIQDCRNACLQMVNKHFDEYQKEVQKMVVQESKKNGYHDSYRLDSISAFINKEISSLIQCSQELNSVNFLESTKRIRKQVLNETKHAHGQLTQELEKNQQFEPSIQRNGNALKELKNSLKKMMQIRFKYPTTTKNSSVLDQISTKKSITDNIPKNQCEFNNNGSVKFQSIPQTGNNNAHGMMNCSVKKVPQILSFSIMNGYFPSSNSSLVIKRVLPSNSLGFSNSNWRPASPIAKQSISFVRNSHSHSSLDNKTRPVSMNSSVTNLIPKSPFILNNNSQIDQTDIHKKNKFNFQPQYTQFKENSIVKHFVNPNTQSNQNKLSNNSSMMKRSCSKKGIKLCNNSQVMSEAARQNAFSSSLQENQSMLR